MPSRSRPDWPPAECVPSATSTPLSRSAPTTRSSTMWPCSTFPWCSASTAAVWWAKMAPPITDASTWPPTGAFRASPSPSRKMTGPCHRRGPLDHPIPARERRRNSLAGPALQPHPDREGGAPDGWRTDCRPGRRPLCLPGRRSRRNPETRNRRLSYNI